MNIQTDRGRFFLGAATCCSLAPKCAIKQFFLLSPVNHSTGEMRGEEEDLCRPEDLPASRASRADYILCARLIFGMKPWAMRTNDICKRKILAGELSNRWIKAEDQEEDCSRLCMK